MTTGPHSGPDKCLSARHRLVKSTLFSETFAQKRRWVGRYMVLWLRSGADASLRLGVITSKKVSLRANQRNRVRRRMREAYRNCRPYFSGHADVILVGRRAAIEASWPEIVGELLKLAHRAGVISGENKATAEQELVTNDTGQKNSPA
ncbi:MAG: ribonuclease P protein component [Kiritimatiellales bacterium]|nr:ribonuclease P protein component [Kiritimatiellales bacterium]